MRQKCYLTLATGRVLRLSHMGSDVGQIFPTASLHKDHSISCALVCEKELSHMKTMEILIWCARKTQTCICNFRNHRRLPYTTHSNHRMSRARLRQVIIK